MAVFDPQLAWTNAVAKGHTSSMPHASALDPLATASGWLDLGPGWLFASIRDAVIVADAATAQIALWNPAATALFGFTSHEALGMSLADLIVDLEGTPQWAAANAGEADPGAVELYARRKDAPEVCIELTLSRVESTADQRAYLLAVIRDITERRIAEEERIDRIGEHHAREQSAAAQRRLEVLAQASQLLDASLDYEATLQEVAHVAVGTLADWCIVHILEPDGAIRWLAVACGDPDKESVARKLQERYPATDGVTRVLRTGVSEIYSYDAGSAGDPRDGGDLRESQRAARARDPEHLLLLRELDSRAVMIVPLAARGRTLGALSLISTRPGRAYTAIDLAIAEELARRCGQAVENARLHQEAQAAVKARDRFVSIASHELRTPIARVKGYAEMVLAAHSDGDLTDEMLERSLQRIDQASDRLATLVRDLLDVSKISAGTLPMRLRTVDSGELVREVVGRYQEHLNGKGLLSLEIVGSPGAVFADPDRIEQVLINLLDNAMKYSPDGAHIKVRAQSKARGVLLEVVDRGIGLAPEDIERVFEPFSRAPNAEERQIAGMGLGLYICRNIVKQHHGRIWAHSTGQDSGTHISVWLPEHGATYTSLAIAA
jgi:PAS domain S-box-containing protein